MIVTMELNSNMNHSMWAYWLLIAMVVYYQSWRWVPPERKVRSQFALLIALIGVAAFATLVLVGLPRIGDCHACDGAQEARYSP
jgi:heme A synthase